MRLWDSTTRACRALGAGDVGELGLEERIKLASTRVLELQSARAIDVAGLDLSTWTVASLDLKAVVHLMPNASRAVGDHNLSAARMARSVEAAEQGLESFCSWAALNAAVDSASGACEVRRLLNEVCATTALAQAALEEVSMSSE